MPTPDGRETIGERLTRLRADLVRARAALARIEDVGQVAAMGGASFTLIGYEQAQKRVERLESQIRALEARLSGEADRSNVAVTATRMAD